MTSTDPGSVASRKGLFYFTSRVLDAKVASPKYLAISWIGKTPVKTTLCLRVRAAAKAADLAKASWSACHKTSPASITATKGRYIQYQAELGSENSGNTPVLDRVVILHQ